MDEPTKALYLRGLGKTYPNGTEALRDIGFSVECGEFVFVFGPSGAGKTTLIKVILALERPTCGDILVFGRNLTSLRPSSIPYLRRNIGVVFQDFRLLNHRTVFENVALPLAFLGLSRAEIRSRVEGALFELGIDRYARAYPPMLSGGEQQRVAIARALVMEPALILADEPTGNLDFELSQEVVRIFEDLNRRGASVLMATHDRFLLRKFRKRVLVLNRGFLVEHLESSEVISDMYEGGSPNLTDDRP